MTSNLFKSLNYESQPLPDLTSPFKICCPPRTDLWTKPPATESFNAPIIYHSLILSSFKSITVTVSADWKQQYDQGGLVVITNPGSLKDQSEKTRCRWVKTGIEFLDGTPYLGTVATDRWSDWSLRPLPSSNTTRPDSRINIATARIQIKASEDGKSLWVYLIEEGGNSSPLREVTWWGDLDSGTECWVGVYAAKPDSDESVLEVAFEGLV